MDDLEVNPDAIYVEEEDTIDHLASELAANDLCDGTMSSFTAGDITEYDLYSRLDRISELQGGSGDHQEDNALTLHGVGYLTLFGLNSRFSEQFPAELTGRVAPEEFRATLRRINAVLRKNMPFSFKWLICGWLCCCCSLGCSMWPVICLNRRTRRSLNKALESENVSLYRKLGLKWVLARRQSDNSYMVEFVLQLHRVPKCTIYAPD